VSSLYTWKGTLCQLLPFPVSMWFLISLVCSSHISSQLLHFFSSSFPCLYPAVGYISLVVPVLGGEFSAHFCNSHCLSCLEVTKGLGENGTNFFCHMGATQPIGIFLPTPSCKSMQLCGFDILPLFNSFCCSPVNGSPPFPSSSPLFLPPRSIFPIVVWMCGLPAPDMRSQNERERVGFDSVLKQWYF